MSENNNNKSNNNNNSKSNNNSSNNKSSAFDQMKYEVANELGVQLNQDYNGDKTSRENGSIGGRITQKVFDDYKQSNQQQKQNQNNQQNG